MDEFELIRHWFSRPSRDDRVIAGVGDDAALLAPLPGQQLVMTMDTLVAGRHFPEDLPAFDVGWRSLAVNLSDLAAMGADPAWCLLSLSLPDADESWLQGFSEGFFALAEKAGIELVGGDTVRGPLSITVQATGQLPEGLALRRNGARPGDRICIGGVPGEAAAGLAAWQQGQRDGVAVNAFCRPEPQLDLGRKLRRAANACIDVSDGLLADLQHILDDSGSLGAELDLTLLPHSAAFEQASPEQRMAWQLSGGDDYLLLFTLPAPVLLPQGCLPLGRVIARSGITGVTADGEAVPLASNGYNHFPRETS